MPLDLVIDNADRVIVMHGSGVLTDADLALAHSKCEAISEADRSFARLCDLSNVTDVSVSAESLNAWASDPVSNPLVLHAIICNAPLVLKRVLDFVALSRQTAREVSVFPTRDKAMEWLREERYSTHN